MKLTVSIITYNHVNFITQAIESVLMQQTNFDFEILIGEDESTDGTREIVRQYEAKYPDKIRVFYHTYPPDHKRVNGRLNFVNNIKNAQGKYIALLEGDDYWTDPCKLQKQVDFLEIHPDFAICFHNVQIIYDDNSKEPHTFNRGQKDISTVEDLAQKNFIHTASSVFRNHLFYEFPQWFLTVPVGDWPLFIILAEYGKIKYIDETMAVYRMHKGGIWGALSQIRMYEKRIKIIKILNEKFNYKYRAGFSIGLSYLHLGLFKLYRPNNFVISLFHAAQLWKLNKRTKIIDKENILKILIGEKYDSIKRKMRVNRLL